MKTLVTGGNGFIGSHLVKALLAQGREVIIASERSPLNSKNLLNLDIKTSDIEFRKADLTNYEQTLDAIKGADIVFHLAATVGNLEYLHLAEMAELSALQNNLTIDANVFKACQVLKVGKIVYASSCAVYPMHRQFTTGVSFHESSLELIKSDYLKANSFKKEPSIIDPDGGYGWSKLLGEIQLCWMKGCDVGLARIFNIYGTNEPLGRKAHVIGDLISKVIMNTDGDMVVQGNGKQTRDFLHVSDCVNALLKLEDAATNPPIIINIGSGQAVEIGFLAKKVVDISGKNIRIIFDPLKPCGPVSRTADIEKAVRQLKWRPAVDLTKGLIMTYEWINKSKSDQQ